MGTPRTIDVQHAVDHAPLSRLQKLALGLCFTLAMIDGFDSLVIGFVVPAIAADWHTTAAGLTPVVLAGLLGTIAGALLLAPLADRIGRRAVINGGVVVFGVFTLAATLTGDVGTLATVRLIAGLGLGAVAPNLIGYGAEFAPQRIRATVVTLTGAGLAAGGFLGGFLAGWLIPAFGWRSVFVVGGLGPLVLAAITVKFLPETVQFVAARRPPAQAARLLARLDPALEPTEEDTFVLPERPKAAKVPVADLFTEGRALTTVLLWVVYFDALLLTFFIFSWMPSILTEAGLAKTAPLIATSVCTLGGMIGGVLLGVVADRVRSPSRMLAFGFLLAAVATWATAQTVSNLGPLLFAAFVLGVGVIGTQTCVNAVATGLYPVKIRGTGIGWAYGIGRVGSLVGPAIGGALLAAKFGAQNIFLLAIVPAVLAAVAMMLLSMRENRAMIGAAADARPPGGTEPQSA